jgi:hypothetical protein
MFFKGSALILFMTLFGQLTAWSHPTSYKDAIGLMSYNTPDMTEILLTYSISHKFAVATTYLRDSKSEFYIPRLNFLVQRWNNDDSQGNIYFSAGAGYEKFDSENRSVRLAELVMDWESRKYYVYMDHLYLNRDNEKNLLLKGTEYNHTKFRLGTAPFLADYNDLNVWFIIQAEKHLNEKQIEMTQFLRFYIKNTLWEVGARFDGGWAFNYMIHF